jgi:hypothetical protein
MTEWTDEDFDALLQRADNRIADGERVLEKVEPFDSKYRRMEEADTAELFG